MGMVGELSIAPYPALRLLFFLRQLQPLDDAVLQQKPSVNAVATLEKVIEIQSAWGQTEGLLAHPAQEAGPLGAGSVGISLLSLTAPLALA